MLKLYKFLSYILIPIILINLYFRILKKKEDKKRYKERFGSTITNFEFSKKVIWLHAASIGEFKSSDIIIEKYYKNFNILVTTTTNSSAEYVKKFYNHKVIHQYIPFDVPTWCVRFLNYWKPSLVLWIESDIWPNMLKLIKDKKIKSIYINARMSPKSFNKWNYSKRIYSLSLSTFDKIFVQSHNDSNRIIKLCNSNVEYIGNLKLSNNHKTKISISKNKKIDIMIASSHKSEENLIISNLENIIKKKKLKLCIAPRHPERINEIVKIVKNYNLTYELDSEKKGFNNDVILIDSFGKLDSYFNNTKIVILGGSFISKGGHNPIEPAKYGCAVISGSFVYNWQNIYDEMVKENACLIISDMNNLKIKIGNIILEKYKLELLKKNALSFSNKKFFDSKSLFDEINLVLN